MRDCYLVSLNDLDGGRQYVRDKISGFFNDLVAMGVRGFRVDASKYMWPGDLETIQDMTRYPLFKLTNLALKWSLYKM